MNIKVEHVDLKYGRRYALKDICFELSGEKIYGLLGRNGAGKTSLLSLLASFREPTAGSITINGEQPFENRKIMQQVAFLYNKDFKDESDHALEMLESVQRYRPHFDNEYAQYLLDRFHIDRKKPMKQFSKGMQSALQVVIGLASQAPITILDEVYLGMDAPSREIFYKELLEAQARHPRMMILSTHLVSEMEYLFDEVLVIHEGKLLLHEEYETLLSKAMTVIGDEEIVAPFVQTKRQLNVQTLGKTKAVTVFGEFSEADREEVLSQGLAVEPVTLHDLFVHLTEREWSHD